VRTTLSALEMKATNPPPPYPVRIAVMGGGNFGLAMASIVARQGHQTTILVRSEAVAYVYERNIPSTKSQSNYQT
jgi:glycerol-3-phosphate dehydrogenase (NAD+)